MIGSHPSVKLGRNDPCICGSGKKYKRCCLMSQHVPDESPWQKQRDAADRLGDELLKFAKRRFGDRLPEVWADYNQEDFPDSLDNYPAEEQLFFPYFFYDWDPDRPRLRRGQRPKPGIVAQGFLLEKARRLSDLERAILEQNISQPNSFYEVLRCEPGHGMRLRDVLIGGEAEVEEHAGSRLLRQGNLVYARLCRLPDVTSLTCLAPVAIPPRNIADIVALRIWLRKKAVRQNRELETRDLFRYAEKIRHTYLDIRDSLHGPPHLANTDGEPLELHTLTFRVGSAQVAFDALAPLAWGWSKEELLEDAELDEDGTLRSVEIDWVKKGNKMHKHWDNTIMGHMKISGRSLVVDVNSANRAAKIRKEIEDRLGMMAFHLGTRVQTQEEMIEEAKQRRAAGPIPQPPQDPELVEMNRAVLQEETEAWVHRRIPLLGGRTPMEAVADPDGREIVESLLWGWERDNSGPVSPDLGAVRRLLNLPVGASAK
jgi:hypothetical protein